MNTSKMRAVWCLVVVSVAVVYGKSLDSIVVISPERAPGIAKASSECIKKFNLDKEIMQKFFAWELTDSEDTRNYMYCLGVESGYIAEDGSMVKNEVLSLVGNHRDRMVDVIDECNKSKYDDKHEAVYRIVMCFRDKSGLQLKVY